MIVVGRHGRGWLRRVLGSVGSGLAHHAYCPVAVVPDEDPLMPDPAFAPTVLGIDGSSSSESATRIAFEEAALRGVELVALHACCDWGGQEYPLADWVDLVPRGRELLAQRLADWRERYRGVTVRPMVVPSDAAKHSSRSHSVLNWSLRAVTASAVLPVCCSVRSARRC